MPSKKKSPDEFDPSQPLADPQQEKFARLRASGGYSILSAYKKAGYEPDWGNASRLTSNDKVSARIQWFQEQSATTAVLTSQEKREFLALAARTPLAEIDENHILCQSVKRRRLMDSDDDGWEVEEIKAVDKLNAIKIDNEMAGHNKPAQVEISGGLDILEAIRSLTHGGANT